MSDLTELAEACERAADGALELALEYEKEANTSVKRWRIDALTEQARLTRGAWWIVKEHARAIREGRVTVRSYDPAWDGKILEYRDIPEAP